MVLGSIPNGAGTMVLLFCVLLYSGGVAAVDGDDYRKSTSCLVINHVIY